METNLQTPSSRSLKNSQTNKASQVTMAGVGELAGVSKATVSMVLNQDPRITEPTRAKVLSAVQSLGYEMNQAARALALKRREKLQARSTGPDSLVLTS